MFLVDWIAPSILAIDVPVSGSRASASAVLHMIEVERFLDVRPHFAQRRPCAEPAKFGIDFPAPGKELAESASAAGLASRILARLG
jgi:hypothetical protein